VTGELREINERYPDGALPADVEARWDALRGEADNLQAAIERQATIDDYDRRAAGTPLSGGGGAGKVELRVFAEAATPAPERFDGLVLRTQDGRRVPILESRHRLQDFVPASESRSAELGLGGFLRALYSGASSELERRVMAESSIGSGGALVPTPLSAEVIDLLRAKVVAFQAGARTIPMASQTLRFAQIVADPVGSWRAESAAIAEDSPAFGGMTLTAKSWALLVRVSRELLEDGVNVDAQLQNLFAKVAALALDRAILAGTGAANQPLGLTNTAGIQTISMGVNGAELVGWAPVLDAALALDTANAGTISALVMAPRTARVLQGLVDSLGQPLRPPPRLADVPQLVTTSMATDETQGTATTASSMLLGDFSEIFVGLRTELMISILHELFADTGEIGFVLWLRGDVGIARPAALCRIEGITP
jgi:HK97 family phage major capsid protein